MAEATLGPVRGKARIEVLDILRGIAILGIFYMNVPFMGNSGWLEVTDPRLIGWSPADMNAFAAIQVFWEGTQRGLLEFLFGAGAMVLTAKAMAPAGPVAVADLFYRRNLWLLAFGLFDIFVICWPGDILHIYALAALVIFPFRKLSAKVLIPLGLIYAAGTGIGWIGSDGYLKYQERTELVRTVDAAKARQAAHQPLVKKDVDALKEWQGYLDKLDIKKPLPPEMAQGVKAEADAHKAGPMELARGNWAIWKMVFVVQFGSFFSVLEAICGMLLGMAFWKLGIIQGQRSKGFYAAAAVLAYGAGCGLRGWGMSEVLAFTPAPKSLWITAEAARLAVSFGHLALVNMLVQTRAGKALLAPFKAAGQTAFSLYFLTSLLGIWFIFAPWGLGLWGQYSWAGLSAIATIVVALLLAVANVWVRFFANGPLEWAWRSLAYWQRQPFLRHRGDPTPVAEPGTEVNAPLPA